MRQSRTLAVLFGAALSAAFAADDPPTEWIEPATGHQVVRLSREPGTSSFYFHQNAYTADGDKLVVSTRTGLSTINLKTRQLEQMVEGRAGNVIVGKTTRQVFYLKDGTVFATHLDTKTTRELTKLSAELRGGSGFAVNADESLKLLMESLKRFAETHTS